MVDYVLMDVEAISMVASCRTLPMEDLNTSDHLPLTVSLTYEACSLSSVNMCYGLPKIDWDQARKSGAIADYMMEVQARLAPLLNSLYSDGDQMSEEIEQVARLLSDAADRILPYVQPKRKSRWRDATLSCLCAQSCAARRAWKVAGCPTDGPLYEEKGRLRRAVRRRVRFCAARVERLRIQRRERMFAVGSRGRFRAPHRGKSRCTRLVVDGGEVVSDPESLLQVWASHLSQLCKSRGDDLPGLEALKERMDLLALQSNRSEEVLLDVPFSSEEVSAAIEKLKNRKAARPDGLMVEHLKLGGESVVTWLTNILNAVVELEVVPDALKTGLVIPVYKGGGKDPLKVNSYRGVTLTSMVAKVLEFLVLERLQMIFLEANLPHINQTAYRKSVSCADAIFATQEVIARYMRGGSRVYMCLYDLQKAFDSVEYPVC